jgi:hypothetical protein
LGPFPINPELSALEFRAGDIKRSKGRLRKRQGKGSKDAKNCQETEASIRPAYMFKHWISFLQVGLPIRTGGPGRYALLGVELQFILLLLFLLRLAGAF